MKKKCLFNSISKSILSLNITKIFLFTSILISISCNKQNILFRTYAVGECLQEIDSRLLESEKVKNKIFGIHPASAGFKLIFFSASKSPGRETPSR